MTIPELIAQTKNQVSLLRALVDSHANDIKDYPKGNYNLSSLTQLEHCFNTLLTLNDLLVKPITEDLAGEVDPLPPAG
jgi:hypothetical protein